MERNSIALVIGFAFFLTLTVMIITALLTFAKRPEERILCLVNLFWSTVSTLAFGYGLYVTFLKRVWFASTYSENYVNELLESIRIEFDRRGFKYSIKKSFNCYRFYVLSPFRAIVTVREWTHFSYGRLRGSKGTIVEVKPHPSNAPEEFKEAMRLALMRVGLFEFAAEWY